MRAAIAHDTYSAHQGVEHDDLNVLCLGGRVIGVELAVECARAFVGALSQQLPLRLIEQIMPYAFSFAWNTPLAYWLPRSE